MKFKLKGPLFIVTSSLNKPLALACHSCPYNLNTEAPFNDEYNQCMMMEAEAGNDVMPRC